MKIFLRLEVWVLVLLLALSCSTGTDPSSGADAFDRNALTETVHLPLNDKFYNPILGTGADPWMTFHDGMYYFTNSSSTFLFIISSPTISGLMGSGSYKTKHIFETNSVNLTSIWSPELHFYKGYWYCFFAAIPKGGQDRDHRIYIIKSKTSNAMGDWEFKGQLVLPPFDQKAIGPHMFVMDNSKLYFGFTGNVSLEAIEAGDKDEQLYLVELNADDPTQVISANRTLISKSDYAWEKKGLAHNEGVTVIKSPQGTRYCIYSASWAGTNYYCLGMLKLSGTDPLAPGVWTKYANPVFESFAANEVYGPGHASFTKSPDGTEDWIIYHSNKRNDVQWVRSTRAQKFTWVNDEPVFGDPSPLDDPQTLPSGETVNRIIIAAGNMNLENGAVLSGQGENALVTFPNSSASVSVAVSVPSNGNYAVYVRYRNNGATKSEIDIIKLQINKNKYFQIDAGISGENRTMSEIGVSLFQGMNLLSFSTPSGLQISAIIVDKTPISL